MRTPRSRCSGASPTRWTSPSRTCSARPATRFVADEADVPPSLRIFADEQSLSPRDFEQLASIRWRKGEVPTSSERWRFILQSLQASRQFDGG